MPPTPRSDAGVSVRTTKGRRTHPVRVLTDKEIRDRELKQQRTETKSILVAALQDLRKAIDTLDSLLLRRVSLPNGDAVIIPKSAQEGEPLVLPDGRVYLLGDNAREAVQINDG